MKKQDILIGSLVGVLVVLAAFSRLMPHIANFTPMAAIILFSVSSIRNSIFRFVLPALTIVFSDVLIQISTGYGFHSGTILVYSSYIILAIMAYLVTKNSISPFKLIFGSLLGSILFFLITNFAFFYTKAPVSNPLLGQYTHDLTGVLTSYQGALPFFRNSLLGDLFFNSILFGSFYVIKSFIPKTVLQFK